MEAEGVKQANRIQTSILNPYEKKALVWLANRQPKWMTSDGLTFIGVVGAAIAGLGYWLSDLNFNWLWLSSLGFFINWYGDSLDGTLARVRNQQRKTYGFYLDHTMDSICEGFIFIGVGLSNLLYLPFALLGYVGYQLLSANVDINAHLKGEFKLTYAKLGPTEFRVIMIIINTLLIFIKPLQTFRLPVDILGHHFAFTSFDLAGIGILVILYTIFFVTVYHDAKGYAKMDPLIKHEDNK